jgi:hypothetical protein
MLTELSLAQLNVAHNRAVVEHHLPFKEIKGFHDKPTGVKRLTKIMAQFGLELAHAKSGWQLVKAADGLAGLNADMAGLAAHGKPAEEYPLAPAKTKLDLDSVTSGKGPLPFNGKRAKKAVTTKQAAKAVAKGGADLVAQFKKAMKAAKPDTAPKAGSAGPAGLAAVFEVGKNKKKAAKAAPAAKKVAKVKKAAKPDALQQMADALVKPRMHRGPVPEFADHMVITILVTNPKKLGSEAHRRYDLYRSGMTVGEARAAGLKRTDFRYDTHPKRKHVSIV